MGNLQSNASSSTQTTGKKNDVFLNFRGVDTGDGFTNYLYEALRRKSIETFMDEVGIEKGEEIWPKLAKTIRDSLIFVAIFSKEYASSKWCLRELVEIMKSGQTVIPVFYKVTVHDVRHQEGSFKDGFDRLEKELQENLENEQVDSAGVEKRKQEFDEEKRNWRQALKAACDLKGWPYENGPELKVIDEIVKDISEKLMRACKLSPCDFEGLFGFEERFKKVMSLLSLDNTDTRIIGIWGMGGIGKTTLADAIFHQISNEFRKCFIQNIRQRLEQCGGLVSVLQQEVLSTVLNDPNVKLYGVTLPQHIKEKLCREKVFIVLDDVDDFLKLEELAGGLHQLGPGSRIVITTRRRDILELCKVNDDYIYKVKGLSNQEAHQLFCQYAFSHSPPAEDLMALSHETLRAIDGNPLALKVAGSSLLGLTKLEWQSALSKLKKSPEILEVLQISYNRLAPEHQNTFLDIACFFVGKNEDYVVKILDCPYSLKVLSNRSLITISNNKIIQMHDLLQEMGREIVRKEDLNNPGNRSRLWTQEVVLDTLKNGYGTNAMRGIFLNMSQMNEEHLNSQAFEKMTNLMILKIYDSTHTYGGSKLHFPYGISYLSNKLKCFNWFGYPLKTLPSNFNPAYLIELDLSYSNIEVLWEKSTRAPKLKWIFLKYCPYLTKVSSHLDAQGLEKIDIKYCDSFCGITSGDRFPSLKYLCLEGCNKLTRILHLDAPSLKEIYIHDCDNFLGFTSRARFSSLTYFCLEGCNKLTQISDHLDAPSLEKIDIRRCDSFLGFAPHDHFPSLTYLHLEHCNQLTTISERLDAPSLEQIDIESCGNLLHFPPPAQHFNKLREVQVRNCENLNLIWCQRLQSLPSIIHYPSLISLTLHWCHKPIKISDLFYAPSLEVINVCRCSALLEFSSPVDRVFNNLREVRATSCKNLRSFGKNIHFPSLVSVDLSWCDSLTEVADFLDAPSLEKICLYGCNSLRQFPRPSQHFNNLRRLNLSFCKDLRSFPSDIHFPSLTSLSFSSCINLEMLYMSNTAIHEAPSTIESSICKLKALECLDLKNCSALKCFPEILDTMGTLKNLNLNGTAIKGLPHSIENLSGLETLDMSECKNLEMIPSGIYNLKSLRKLCLSCCSKLENLPGNLVTDLSNCGEPATTKPPSWNTAIHEVPSTIESSICKLKALECLDLENCSALKCFPEILDTMGSLKNLNLNGTAIKGLPHSIENLSGLETLYLRECKNLEMIPSGIYNLKSLCVLCLSGCSKLENLPGNLVTDLSNCGEVATARPPSWRLDGCEVDFANCLKLDKTAVINIIELQINQHRDMTTKGCGTQAVNLKYLYPGSEVPGWFNCQTNGSSINIQMSDHDGVNGHLIGFALCAVIEGCRFHFEIPCGLGCYYDFDIGYEHRCHCKNLSLWENNLIKFVSVNATSTEHVALWYSNAPVLQLCGQCTNYLFEFCLSDLNLQVFGYSNVRVKYCGVCPIYEKHNITLPSIAYETCGATITSVKEHGKIRKFSDEAETGGRSNEDVIEPNPKRTCSSSNPNSL